MPGLRLASEADVPDLARALARAFMDDPIAEWSCPPERLRPAVLERFHGNRLRQLLHHREVWTTDERSCAALWAPPGCWRTTLREDFALARGQLIHLISGDGLGLEMQDDFARNFRAHGHPTLEHLPNRVQNLVGCCPF